MSKQCAVHAQANILFRRTRISTSCLCSVYEQREPRHTFGYHSTTLQSSQDVRILEPHHLDRIVGARSAGLHRKALRAQHVPNRTCFCFGKENEFIRAALSSCEVLGRRTEQGHRVLIRVALPLRSCRAAWSSSTKTIRRTIVVRPWRRS